MASTITVQEICQEAREVFLDDTFSGEIFTDGVLFPYVKRALSELNSKLARIGHQVTEQIPAILPIPASQVPMGIACPDDLIEPISMYERAQGDNTEDAWREMERERNLHPMAPVDTLGSWDWVDNTFRFRGVTVARQIRVQYSRFLTPLVGSDSQIFVINSKPFLSARVAALAAGHIGANAEKAAYIQLDADVALDDMLGIAINFEQATPVRRKPFRR